MERKLIKYQRMCGTIKIYVKTEQERSQVYIRITNLVINDRQTQIKRDRNFFRF